MHIHKIRAKPSCYSLNVKRVQAPVLLLVMLSWGIAEVVMGGSGSLEASWGSEPVLILPLFSVSLSSQLSVKPWSQVPVMVG